MQLHHIWCQSFPDLFICLMFKFMPFSNGQRWPNVGSSLPKFLVMWNIWWHFSRTFSDGLISLLFESMPGILYVDSGILLIAPILSADIYSSVLGIVALLSSWCVVFSIVLSFFKVIIYRLLELRVNLVLKSCTL